MSMRSWIVSGYAIVLGIIIGLVSWLFLSVVYKGIHVGWHTIPEQFDIPFYLFLVPIIAGVCIGLLQHRYGRMPEVMEERKDTGRIDYRLIGCTTLTAPSEVQTSVLRPRSSASSVDSQHGSRLALFGQ